MKSIEIDRSKRLKDEPHTGHNRWHPDIPPLIEVAPGDEVVLETRDAADVQIKKGMSSADLAKLQVQGSMCSGKNLRILRTPFSIITSLRLPIQVM